MRFVDLQIAYTNTATTITQERNAIFALTYNARRQRCTIKFEMHVILLTPSDSKQNSESVLNSLLYENETSLAEISGLQNSLEDTKFLKSFHAFTLPAFSRHSVSVFCTALISNYTIVQKSGRNISKYFCDSQSEGSHVITRWLLATIESLPLSKSDVTCHYVYFCKATNAAVHLFSSFFTAFPEV